MEHGARLVCRAVRQSSADFRTVGSLADETGMPPSLVHHHLSFLEREGLVRRPVMLGRPYDEWFRDTRRGLTRQERRARWRAIVTFTPMRDGF